MKDRKGIAKLSIQQGTTIIPAYTFSNMKVFSGLYDHME